MRTEQRYDNVVLQKDLNLFTPRLRNDLITILLNSDDPFKNIPEEIGNTYIYGPVEYGKTVYAALLTLQYKKASYLSGSKNDKCLFVSVPDLIRDLKDSHNRDNDQNERSIIEQCRQVDLLVLDDFGMNKPTEYVLEILYLIINYRYEYLKKTIFTSNLSLKEVSEIYGDSRITRRIGRMCKVIKKKNYKLTK